MKEQNKKAKLIIVRERGDVIDFDERRKSIKATIKRDIEVLETHYKYGIGDENDNCYTDAITTLISNLHHIEDGLKGRFDVVVIPENHDSQIMLEGT